MMLIKSSFLKQCFNISSEPQSCAIAVLQKSQLFQRPHTKHNLCPLICHRHQFKELDFQKSLGISIVFTIACAATNLTEMRVLGAEKDDPDIAGIGVRTKILKHQDVLTVQVMADYALGHH